MNFLGLMCDTFSQGYFYYLMIMTGYWFIFYKMQSVPYSLIPPIDETYDKNYRPFHILFFTMAVASILGAVYTVRK